MSGGNVAVIKGSGFTGTTSVKSSATTPATAFSVIDGTTILAVGPAHPAALVNVWVTTAIGTNTTAMSSWYTYHDALVGSITGTVTPAAGGAPLQNMCIVFAKSSPLDFAGLACSAANGTFTIANLAPGTYKAATVDPAQLHGSASYYLSRLYDNKGPVTLVGTSTGTDITVTQNAVTALKQIVLI